MDRATWVKNYCIGYNLECIERGVSFGARLALEPRVQLTASRAYKKLSKQDPRVAGAKQARVEHTAQLRRSSH